MRETQTVTVSFSVTESELSKKTFTFSFTVSEFTCSGQPQHKRRLLKHNFAYTLIQHSGITYMPKYKI